MDPQQQLNQILQQQLRDVHLPEPISWWPLAASWWILLGLIIVCLFFAIRAFANNRARNAYRHQARKQLDTHYRQWQSDANINTYLQSANAVLKRVSLHLEDLHLESVSIESPRLEHSRLEHSRLEHSRLERKARQLSGLAWLSYLQSFSSSHFSESTEHALSQGIYQKSPDYDVAQIHRELAQWLVAHKRQNIELDREVNHA